MTRLWQALKSIPWFIWLGLVSFPILWTIGQLTDGVPIHVVAAGPGITTEDLLAPEGVILATDILPNETTEQTEIRVNQAINRRPTVLMFAFDVTKAQDERSVLQIQAAYERLASRSEVTGIVPVILAPSQAEPTPFTASLFEGWRQMCARDGLRLCVDLSEATTEEDRKSRVRQSLLDAIERQHTWRASTQVGR